MVKNNLPLNLELRAVVYREGDFHLAHCLETDLVVEGRSADDAVQALLELLGVQIKFAMEHGDVASIFRPAPAEFWKLYASAKPRRTRKMSPPLARFESREVVLN